ncbi:MAG: zinc ribbon domain-containing protein, partial [Planctomycetota bacterium]
RTVGARGLAGSGVLLDPEQAREDLEPYSRMAGGMVKDAMTEADIDLSGKPERIIMIRCTSCDALCQESANFCQQCGAKL